MLLPVLVLGPCLDILRASYRTSFDVGVGGEGDGLAWFVVTCLLLFLVLQCLFSDLGDGNAD